MPIEDSAIASRCRLSRKLWEVKVQKTARVCTLESKAEEEEEERRGGEGEKGG